MKPAEYYIDLILKSKILSFLLLFIIFALFNFRELDNPPYWDEILGLHNQAIWLAENNFDFGKLYVQEQTYENGGSLIYALGVMPFVYGAMYYSLPPPAVHILGHLINIAALAFAGMLMIRILRRFSVNSMIILWVLATFTEPLILSRMATQDQEAVLAAVIMLSISEFLDKRFYRAVLIGAFCCFVKFTGIVLLIAYVVWFVMAHIIKKDADERKVFIKGFLLTLLAGGIICGLFKLIAFPAANEKAGILNLGIMLVIRQIKYFYCWVFLELFAASLLFVVLWWKSLERRKELEYLLLPIFIYGYFFSYFVHSASPQIPRYSAIVIVPLVLFLAYSARVTDMKKQMVLALVFFVVHLLNMNGLLSQDIPSYYLADGSQLERSREFLDAIDADSDLCRFVEQNKPDSVKMLCKWPHVQMLTMPKLRYVKKPVKNVFCLGTFPKYSKAEKLGNIENLDRHTWILYSPDSFDLQFQPSLHPITPESVKTVYSDSYFMIYSGIRFSKQR